MSATVDFPNVGYSSHSLSPRCILLPLSMSNKKQCLAEGQAFMIQWLV